MNDLHHTSPEDDHRQYIIKTDALTSQSASVDEGAFQLFERQKIVLSGYKKDGKNHGQFLCFTPIGGVQCLLHYHENTLHGRACTFYENQTLAHMWTYEQGYRQGLYYVFFNTGVLYEKGTYEEDEKHGWTEIFHDDGSLKERVYYYKGVLFSCENEAQSKKLNTSV